MLNEKRDHDTLGGRVLRAREAGGLSELDLAKSMTVKKTTIQAWESDRSEPRANKLITLAGILGVSPTWLLYGVGEAPNHETVSDEIKIIRDQIGQIRELRNQTDTAISNLESALAQLEKRDGE